MNRSGISILLFLFLFLALTLLDAHAQIAVKSTGEKLGFARDAKLLIVHSDDVGATHSVNASTIRALETGFDDSARVRLPCPWFPKLATYTKSLPHRSVAMHL